MSKPIGFENKYEEQAYDQAAQRYRDFNETYQIYEKLEALENEAHTLYNYTERNNSSSNFFSQRLETDEVIKLLFRNLNRMLFRASKDTLKPRTT